MAAQTCARPLKMKLYSMVRRTSCHGSSAAIPEIWLGTALKCEISCLWRSLRDGACWMSAQYLGTAASILAFDAG